MYANELDVETDLVFFKSAAAPRVLRAGFFLYHGIITTTGRTAKGKFVENIPMELWALLSFCNNFLRHAVSHYGFLMSHRPLTSNADDSPTRAGELSRLVPK